jgi:signal peptidase II
MGLRLISPYSESRTTRPRAGSSLRAWLLLLGVLCVGLGVDLWSKQWAFDTLGPQPVVLERERIIEGDDYRLYHIPPRDVLPWKLLDFRLVINHGAVFGIAAHRRGFFVGFTVIAITIGLFVFAWMTRRGDRLAHFALGCVLAGGLGNLYDRLRFGVVRDFIHMLPDRKLPNDWTWPGGNPEIFPWVFNVADMLLLCGMVLLMLHINRIESRRKVRGQAPTRAATATTAPLSVGPDQSGD